MKTKVSIFVLNFVAILSLFACAITPIAGNWESPNRFTIEQVFDAAVRAGSLNGYIVASQDRNAGTISLSKPTKGLDARQGSRTMTVIITGSTGRIVVRTNIMADVNTLAPVLNEETNNFYVYLTRELGITNPAERQVTVGPPR